MGEVTKIAWADHTFNPWQGCDKVSEGCKHCYAHDIDAHWHPRLKGVTGIGALHWGRDAPRLPRAESAWADPLKWEKKAIKDGETHRVFCASMADVFEQLPKNHPQLDWMDEQRARLWKLINFTPHLTWMLLTKRPENVLRMVPRRWWTDFDGETTSAEHWPRNVWIGATVEDQRRADERIPLLERIPARVRFLSVEPQLGVVVLPITVSGPSWWVIQGGESGRSARKFFTSWAGIMRTMCIARGVPYFLKQLGSNPREVCANCGGHGYPCELCSGGDVRLGLHDRAGADPEEWDDDMRVQQFPEVQP